MIIGPKDTIADVMTKNAALFSLGFARICNEVKRLEPKSHIPLMRPDSQPVYIECRDVLATITMRELDAISDISETDEYFFDVLTTMLKIDRADVPYLQFLGAMRYYMTVLEDLSTIGKAWKKLEVPDESGYKPDHPDRGLLAVVQTYAFESGGAVSFPDAAWDSLWTEVYVAFERARDKYMASRAQIKAQEAKNRNNTPRNYGVKRYHK